MLGGLPFLAPFHTLIAWLFASFIVMHVYLTTTGHTPLAGIKAMMMGWDEVEVHHCIPSGRGTYTGVMTTLHICREQPLEPAPRTNSQVCSAVTKPYINPYLAGILLGMVLFLAFFITGNGLGASGGLNRILVFFEDLGRPGHVDRTPYLLAMAGGDSNPLDSWVVFADHRHGIWAASSPAGCNGRVKVETNRGPQHLDPDCAG